MVKEFDLQHSSNKRIIPKYLKYYSMYKSRKVQIGL